MKVQMLSKLESIFQTVANIWKASRTTEPIACEIVNCEKDITENRELFFTLMDEGIPIMEMVEFIFVLEDIPISLREQIVRHRLGHKFDDKLGLDIVPELGDSNFWVQSMRILDMSDFNFYVPEKIGEYEEAFACYSELMDRIKGTYAELLAMGIPMEDARQVIPLAATHRMVWKLNVTAIKHICSKRSCWIAQLGMWKPIIEGLVSELWKVDGWFRDIVAPPCVTNGKFSGCKFCEHNRLRVTDDGERQVPPCPLYLKGHEEEAMRAADNAFKIKQEANWYYNRMDEIWGTKDEEAHSLMIKMKVDYQNIWGLESTAGKML